MKSFLLTTFIYLNFITLVGARSAREVALDYLKGLKDNDFARCVTLSTKEIREKFRDTKQPIGLVKPLVPVPSRAALKDETAFGGVKNGQIVCFTIFDLDEERACGSILVVFEKDKYRVLFCPCGFLSYEHARQLSEKIVSD